MNKHESPERRETDKMKSLYCKFGTGASSIAIHAAIALNDGYAGDRGVISIRKRVNVIHQNKTLDIWIMTYQTQASFPDKEAPNSLVVCGTTIRSPYQSAASCESPK